MTLAYSFFIGLFLTILLVPLLAKVSGRLGIVDHPGPRKVHDRPIPRVGGIGIAFTCIGIALVWLPGNEVLIGYVAGALVIVVLGIWDDIAPLNYIWKLVGQSIGILILMWVGVRLSHFPFMGLDEVPGYLAYPVTFLFILGVTNSVNLFDGLDGLAGGCIILSFLAIGLLGYEAGDIFVPVIAMMIIGGTFGFLRFNTHPAVVFMGDAGSQFLGFSAAFLAIELTTTVNQALNPLLPFLILGLPVFDTIGVVVRRLLQGRSPFRSDRQHLHHRLMERGFGHGETVAILYSLHILMIILAVSLRYASDLVATLALVIAPVALFAMLYLAEMRGAQVRRADLLSPLTAQSGPVYLVHRLAPVFDRATVLAAVGLSLFLVAGAIATGNTSTDLASICLGVAVVTLIGVLMRRDKTRFFIRFCVYFAALVVLYLLKNAYDGIAVFDYSLNIYVALLGAIVLLLIIFRQGNGFWITPQDILMVLIVVAVPNLPLQPFGDFALAPFILQTAILFYAIEYSISTSPSNPRLLPAAATASLLFIGFASLISA